MITIIDYGLGNLGSIANMLKKIGVQSQVTSELNKIKAAEKIILPGVGAFDTAMRTLESLRLKDTLNTKVMVDKVPVLGICLGMQILGNGSEEGSLKGFGWIPANAYKFSNNNSFKVPHMSWNSVCSIKKHFLVQGMENDTAFYFSHSYYVLAENEEHVIATTNYGNTFHSIINKDNIFGAQFHPEKSHKNGMLLLENFART
jgi:glutamine amidotransferase